MAQGALDLADSMPPGYAFLADQLRRAATSVPLNVSEGNGKPTRKDYLRYLGNARGSLNEVDSIVELLRGRPFSDLARLDALATRIVHTGKLIAALRRSLE